jgi:hypothetical protein
MGGLFTPTCTSLKPYFQEVLPQCYQDARKQASDETGLSLDAFPVDSPFTADESLTVGDRTLHSAMKSDQSRN